LRNAAVGQHRHHPAAARARRPSHQPDHAHDPPRRELLRLAVTARDALGFPLTGASQAQLHALDGDDAAALAETLAAGGFDGPATLADTTATISPASITFADGVAVADVMIASPVSLGTIILPGDPAVISNPFDVLGCNLYLPLMLRSG
jgi:hypothetical protein